MERKNFDLVEKKIKLTSEENRKTTKDVAIASIELIGYGLKTFLKDEYMLTKVVTAATIAYVFAFATKSVINLSLNYLKSYLITPKLVKETSRFSINYIFSKEFKFKMFTRFFKKKVIFDEMIFSNQHMEKLEMISSSIQHKKQNKTFYRNLLFYGPPGNGKTLFAKKLAFNSGLHYAILTGSDVLPLGKNAVTELNKLFDWAEKSSKGLLVFIDESDAFLKRRQNEEIISENLRGVINTFLYRTGTPSTSFFVILGTNLPQSLDEAVQDRVDEIIEFKKPCVEVRKKVIKLSLENLKRIVESRTIKTFLKDKIFRKEKKQIKIEINENDLNSFANKIDGFSNREINKLAIYIFDYIDYKKIEYIDSNVFNSAVDYYLEQHKQKINWNTEQMEYYKRLKLNNKI